MATPAAVSARKKRTTTRTSPARRTASRKAPVKKKSVRTKRDAYTTLTDELREIALLESVTATMGWDQEALMPAKGAALRADQLSLLSTMVHERKTSAKLSDMISRARALASRRGDAKMKANLREIKRDYDKSKQLPSALVGELTKCASLGMDAWKGARAQSDFKQFLPWLTKTIELSREKAQCYGVVRGSELYDALLDDYEPNMTAKRIAASFGPLREQLVPLVSEVRRSKNKPDAKRVHVTTPIDKQREFVHRVTSAIGFDLESGRIDESTHPFCEGLGPGDTRFTNRYSAKGWTEAVLTAMHEAGHGIYEQGLPKAKLFGQPLAEAISLGIHESQSRMYENLVGRSRAFWEWALPEARSIFGSALKGIRPEQVFRSVNTIKPWWIRVESDEVTYNLHVMLRFDLERAMVRGELAPKDLAGEWNARFKRDFGLTVKEDRLGCLQDVHWSMGLVGYFPTYTLGNLYGAQFWEAMAKDIRGRNRQMSRGEFGPILDWLRKNIHTKGRQYSAEDLCKRVTGKPLSSDALVRHLKKKVSEVY